MNSHVFQPPPAGYTLDGSSLPEGLRVRTFEGAVFVETTGDETLSILWVHGNATDLAHDSALLLYVSARLGAHVLGVEYPGYGPAPGKPTPASINEVAQTAYRYLVEEHRATRIVVVGQSLGTGAAAEVVHGRHTAELAGVLLWTPMTTVRDISAGLLGPLSIFVDKRWDVESCLRDVSCPVALVAGGQDTLTPRRMAERLRDAVPTEVPVLLYVNEDASHNEGWRAEEDVVAPLEALLVDQVDPWEARPEPEPKGKEEEEEEEAEKTNDRYAPRRVRIVGAGPVGLFLALSLVARGVAPKELEVVEKHQSYKRHHVLRLERSSLTGAAPSVRQVVAPLVGVTRTAALEEALLAEAEKVGIPIRRPHRVEEAGEALAATERVLVGTDGSHSVVREQLLGGEGERESLQAVLDCRLELRCSDRPRRLEGRALLWALRQVDHVIEESFGRPDAATGVAAGTLRLLISPAEHAALREAGAALRAPLLLPHDASLLPVPVRRSICRWLAVRAAHFPAERCLGASLAAIDLAVYQTSCFGRRFPESGRCVFVCGDAAFGVPFFRALNNGLLCASQLAVDMAEELAGPPLQHPEAFPRELVEKKQPKETAAPAEKESFFARVTQSVAASTGMSRHLADISARGTSNLVRDMALGVPDDPVLRYDAFCRRLAAKEFSVARAKRDGLTIVRLGNRARQSLPDLLGGAPQDAPDFENLDHVWGARE